MIEIEMIESGFVIGHIVRARSIEIVSPMNWLLIIVAGLQNTQKLSHLCTQYAVISMILLHWITTFDEHIMKQHNLFYSIKIIDDLNKRWRQTLSYRWTNDINQVLLMLIDGIAYKTKFFDKHQQNI